ncbi:hypothetical protein ID741_002407 [Enterococcus sp. AZ103]
MKADEVLISLQLEKKVFVNKNSLTFNFSKGIV